MSGSLILYAPLCSLKLSPSLCKAPVCAFGTSRSAFTQDWGSDRLSDILQAQRLVEQVLCHSAHCITAAVLHSSKQF